MANQHTKKQQEEADLERLANAKPDPVFGHLLPGPSNEAIAAKQRELNDLLEKSGMPRIEFGTDSFDKQNFEAWENGEYTDLGEISDPVTQIKREHQRPGMALRLMSHEGNKRMGTRGYRIVKTRNGDPVTFGNMVVGEIPEEIAKKRRGVGIAKANDELRGITNSAAEQIEKLKHDAAGLGLSILQPGEDVKGRESGIVIDRVEFGG